MRPGIYSIALSDAPRRLIWALPRGRVMVRERGPVWDLDADTTDPASLRWRWDDAVASLRDWLAEYRPPVIVEHGSDGPTRDPETGIPLAFGHVVGAHVVTQADAAEYDVDLKSDAIFLEIEATERLAELLDARAVPYTSPGLRADYTDDEGQHWPLIVKELTLTLDPRQKRRQPTHAETAPLSALLSEGYTMQDETPTEAPDLAEMVKALSALAERLTAVESKIAEMAEPDGGSEGEPAEDSADMSESGEVAALRQRVAELEAAAARAKSTAAVDALLSEREIAESARAALVSLHMRSPAEVEAICRAAPKRGTSLKRAPVSGVGADLSDVPAEAQALAMVQRGEAKSISEAWDRVAAMRQGA